MSCAAAHWERRGGGGGGGDDVIDDDDEDFMTESDEDDGSGDERGGGRRSTGGSRGPATWQEVDRGELAASALSLISSIAQTAPTDDKSRDAVWHPTTTVTVTQELVDPLGMGRIDPQAMRLEPRAAREAAPQARVNAAGVNVDSAAQGKGAVGRFFSEMTARGGGKDGGRGAPGGPSGGGRQGDGSPSMRRRASSAAGRASNLPASMLLPTLEGFDPEAYLAVFHEATPAPDLAAGLATLERDLGERQGQLKTLVKQNFDRFISCKTTIDDIYVKLQRIESAGTGISTQVLFSAVQEVQTSAKQAFGPLLERHSKAERIKSVQALLRRFQSLFSMPSRVRALAAARDYEQVCAEYKKANALIRPSAHNTAKVWARLHTEIEKRVSEVWEQLEAEVARPDLPAASAPDLLLHMLALQAEGLPLAAGKDPVLLLLEARDRRARADMAAAHEHHARAVARLRERCCAAMGSEGAKVDPSRLTELQLMAWSDAPPDGDGGPALAAPDAGLHADEPGAAAFAPLVAPAMFVGGASSAAPGVAAIASLGSAPLSVAAGAGGAGGAGARLAPLSGLQPAPLASRLVPHTAETPGEQLMLDHVSDLSRVMLACLPGFWAVAASPRLADAPDLPAPTRAKLRASIKAVAAAAQKLVDLYCRDLQRLAAALVAVGPLRSATAALVQSLSRVVASLRDLKAPPSAVDSVLGVLRYALEAAVRQLAGHLEQLPAALASREGWVVSLTQAGGDAPVTHLPEQLQEEITVAVQYFKAITSTAAPALGGDLPPDITSRPLHVAFFACLGQCTACLAALAERYSPAPAEAAAAAPRDAGASTSPRAAGARGRGGLAFESDDDDGAGPAANASPRAGARAGLQGGRGGVGVGGVAGVSDDVRVLLTASNLSHIRTRLMGSLTQRFLLVLTGEVASEVERVSRTVKGLAKRMDAALQVMFDLYRERKRLQLERLMAAYVKTDGAPVGVPPELRDVSPGVQGLLQALAQVQAEAYTYAREHMSYLVPPLLEAVAGGLAGRISQLPAGSMAPEALAQYFLDLAWLDGVASAAGPPSMRVDIDAGYLMLAQRIAAARARGPPATPLGRSLAAAGDAAELSRKLQVTCRKLLPDIIARSTMTMRSFVTA